jgi:hypothetical protein
MALAAWDRFPVVPGCALWCRALVTNPAYGGNANPFVFWAQAVTHMAPVVRMELTKSSRSNLAELCWQGFQQDAIAPNRLPDMQAALDFPNACCGRLHDRNAQILFERRDDAERIQG